MWGLIPIGILFLFLIPIFYLFLEFIWGLEQSRIYAFLVFEGYFLFRITYGFLKIRKYLKRVIVSIEITESLVRIAYKEKDKDRLLDIKRSQFLFLDYPLAYGQAGQISFYSAKEKKRKFYFIEESGGKELNKLVNLFKDKGFRKPYGHNL